MTKTKKITFLGIMLAAALVLSFIESMLPPFPFMPPNVRIGLSNIVIMYCVFFVSYKSAVALSVLKSLFVFMSRGPVAGLLSFCGGMVSVCVIILLVAVFKDKISYAAVSVAGACFHNLGQYTVAAVMMALLPYFVYYLPALIISGVAVGLVTGTLLKITLPVLHRIPGGRM